MSLKALLDKQRAAQAATMEQSNVATTQTSDPQPAAAAPVSVAGAAKLRFGVGAKRSTEAESVAQQGSTVASYIAVESRISESDASQSPVAELTLADIGDDESSPEIESRPSYGSGFSDEIPCTAPDRELPEDLSAAMRGFVKELDSIYEVIDDPQLFGGVVKVIMQELQEHPEYMKMVADQDVHTLIRGLRESMGLAKIKKAEKSVKARGSKKAPATTAMVSTLDEMFNAEDF